jgi:formylglycine-generating enzyme required for sulfatase activity
LLPYYAWSRKNKVLRAHATRELRPNFRGVFDMHGNVAEWCHDWHAPYPDADETKNYSGPLDGRSRVVRGGSWSSSERECESGYRRQLSPSSREPDVGFRIVVDPVRLGAALSGKSP